jgi:hypothetical protein
MFERLKTVQALERWAIGIGLDSSGLQPYVRVPLGYAKTYYGVCKIEEKKGIL